MKLRYTKLLSIFVLSAAAASAVYTVAAQEQRAAAAPLGAYCNATEDPVNGATVHYDNEFAAIASGKDILFGLTRFAETTGHSCIINDGIAVPSGENQWTYEYEQEGDACKIIISTTPDGGVVIEEAEGSICGMGVCGRQAAIGKFSFSADDYRGETSEEAILYIAERGVCEPKAP